MKQPFFKDSSIQQQFDRDGYVVVDFTTKEMVEKIAALFYNQHTEIPTGFFIEVSNPDNEANFRLFMQMDELLADAMERTFVNYKKLGSTFLCKAPGIDGKVNVHQDWTAVDETKYTTATIWIPTQDVDESNGALRVLPGSHLFFDKYRSNYIPVSYSGSEQLLWDNMLTVPMKAGQAFILNHAVLHASSPNLTNRERLIIAYGITSANAPLRFYFRNKDAIDNKVEQFDMPDDFFLRYNNIGERPLIGNKVDEFDYPVPVVPTQQIEQMIIKEWEQRQHLPYYRDNWHLKLPAQVNAVAETGSGKNFWQRIKSVFGN